jgi:hypothetical protein
MICSSTNSILTKLTATFGKNGVHGKHKRKRKDLEASTGGPNGKSNLGEDSSAMNINSKSSSDAANNNSNNSSSNIPGPVIDIFDIYDGLGKYDPSAPIS